MHVHVLYSKSDDCMSMLLQTLYNSHERMALEVVCVVLAAFFLAVESLDFLQWIIGVYKRRSLMRSASKYKPPLYPIPGAQLPATACLQQTQWYIKGFLKPCSMVHMHLVLECGEANTPRIYPSSVCGC